MAGTGSSAVSQRTVEWRVAHLLQFFRMSPRRVWLGAALLLLAAQPGCRGAPQVVFEGPGGVKARFSVEVADSAEKRRWGLMYRQDLGAGEGMLFIFPEEKDHSFWMKDTPLSLDIIFMDRGGRVVGIVYDTVPFSTRSFGVGVPSLYALEVRAGVARRNGIEVGDQARFERVR